MSQEVWQMCKSDKATREDYSDVTNGAEEPHAGVYVDYARSFREALLLGICKHYQPGQKYSHNGDSHDYSSEQVVCKVCHAGNGSVGLRQAAQLYSIQAVTRAERQFAILSTTVPCWHCSGYRKDERSFRSTFLKRGYLKQKVKKKAEDVAEVLEIFSLYSWSSSNRTLEFSARPLKCWLVTRYERLHSSGSFCACSRKAQTCLSARMVH